jgi:tRNA(Ile)-lysidine synthase TilS/MesJ
METEDERVILLGHGLNILYEFSVLLTVGNHVVEVSVSTVEGVLRSEDVIIQPLLTISDEEFSIEIVSDSTSILYLANHVLDSFP